MSESSAPVAQKAFDEKRQQSAVVPVTPMQERSVGLPVQAQPRMRDQIKSINGFAVQWQGGDLRVPAEAFQNFTYVPPVPPPPMPELSSAAMSLQPNFRPPDQPNLNSVLSAPPQSGHMPSPTHMGSPTHMSSPSHMSSPAHMSAASHMAPTTAPIDKTPTTDSTPPPPSDQNNLTPAPASIVSLTPIAPNMQDAFNKKSTTPQHHGKQSVFRHPQKSHDTKARREQSIDPADTGPAMLAIRLTRADFGNQTIAYFNAPSAFETDLSDLDSIDNGYYYLSGFPDTHTYDVDGSTLLHTGNEICQVAIDDSDPPTMLDVAWYKESYCVDGATKYTYVFRPAIQDS